MVRKLLVSGSVTGVGEERQGAGNAQLGPEILDGNSEILISGQGGRVARFCFAAGEFWRLDVRACFAHMSPLRKSAIELPLRISVRLCSRMSGL